MNEFLSSVKADLLDRRLLPIVALVGLALVAALAYVVLGGGSSSPAPAPAVSAGQATKGIAVSGAGANPDQPAAETTSGAHVQRRGYARDPFNPLPSALRAKPVSTSTAVTSHSSSTTTSGASPTTGANVGSGSPAPKVEPKPTAPSAPSAPTSPSKPAKPKTETVYHVSALFGVLPAVAPPEGVKLTPYDNLKLLTTLPSTKQPLVVYRGVTSGGKSATFTVVGEAILRGGATCLPSAAQCEEIDLKPGQGEQLEYLPPDGQPVSYELRIVSITPASASSAAVVSIRRGASRAGREILRRSGLLAIPGLRYSATVGVLAFLRKPASAARAHASGHRRPRG